MRLAPVDQAETLVRLGFPVEGPSRDAYNRKSARFWKATLVSANLTRNIPLAALATSRGYDRLLLWAFGLLFSVEAVLIIVGIFPVPVVWSLGSEGSYPTYLHSAVLSSSGLIFFTIFALGYRSRGRALGALNKLPVWFFLGIAFFYLSMDEALEIHERVFWWISGHLGIQEDLAHYRITPALWEAFFAPLFAVIAILILVMLFKHRRVLPWAFRLGLTAMGLWSLALFEEFLQLTFFVGRGLWFGSAVWIEESSELLGSTIFLVAAVLIIRWHLGRIWKKGADAEH